MEELPSSIIPSLLPVSTCVLPLSDTSLEKRELSEQTNDIYSRFKNTISLSVPSEDRAASMTVSLM